jgi:hypothetical protein
VPGDDEIEARSAVVARSLAETVEVVTPAAPGGDRRCQRIGSSTQIRGAIRGSRGMRVAFVSRMTRIMLAVVVLAACAPPAFLGQGSQSQSDPQPAPPTPDQDVVNLLNTSGYGCAFESETIGWRCNAPQQWAFYVTQESQADGSAQILYTTYENRAFGKPCTKFQDAIQDLDAQGGAGFEAYCNDQTLQFILRTRYVYQDLVVVDAANDHIARALTACKSLVDIHALSKAETAFIMRR